MTPKSILLIVSDPRIESVALDPRIESVALDPRIESVALRQLIYIYIYDQ